MLTNTEIQKLTLEEKAILLQGRTSWNTWGIPRLGIPSIFLSDGPHGLRKQIGKQDNMGVNISQPATCYPTAATMANSWDPELGEALGQALGTEAAATDIHVVLGPGLNMKRSPLCGRNFEYFSEDPYLAGKMAAAYIRGIQSKGVAACPKHFAANSQEKERQSMDSVVDERTLREIYLTGFEIAIKESDPKAIMTSYNRINGTYANEHKGLLTDTLKNDWGFDGIVMSDWGGSNDHVEGVLAGSTLEMPNPGPDSALSLIAAVREGRLPESVLDDRIRELAKVAREVSQAVSNAPKTYDDPAHQAIARKCAAESIVLLENDGILPLKTKSRIALIGAFADKPRYQGDGSSLVNPTELVSLRQALEAAGVKATYAAGYPRVGTQPDQILIDEAVQTAQWAETVLLCMGLDELAECEGADREHMEIPESHSALLQAVAQVNPNIILVLSGGAPFRMPESRLFRAAVHGYLGGQAGALAMADVLTGAVNPSGHLAESWPEALEDTPCYNYYPSKEVTSEYREGLFVGYRYYDTAGVKVRYPFGHGLSYTSFAYSDLTADSLSASFTLTNTGDMDGAEVAQLYISCRGGTMYRPKKELKGFQKVFLKAGESKRVTIELDDKAFRYFNTVTGKYEVETANYDILIASSVSNVKLSQTIRIFGTDAPVPELALPSYRSGNIKNVPDAEYTLLLGRDIPDSGFGEELTAYDTVRRFRNAKSPLARLMFRIVEGKIEKKRKKGDPASAELYMYNMPIRGFFQMTKGKITRKMVQDIIYLVNGHTFVGLVRFCVNFFIGRKQAREFNKKIKHLKR